MVEVADIRRWYARYGWTTSCVGEWEEIQRNERNELREALENPDDAVLTRLLDHWFRTELWWGLVSLSGKDAETILANLIAVLYYRLGMWSREVRRNDVELLRASPHCDPVVGTIDGVPMMVDQPRFDTYASIIAEYVPPNGVVFEIGGGYGGVALQLQRRVPGIRVVLCDIPETLYLAAWWLSRSLPEGVTVGWWDEHPKSNIILLPIAERAMPAYWIAGKCRPDLVFAAHTFSGLPMPELESWFEFITETLRPRYIYHDDALHRAPSGTWLTDRFPEVMIADMPKLVGYHEQWRRRIAWTGAYDRFSEVFWERQR